MADLTLSVILGATIANGFKGIFGDAGKRVSQLGAAVKATHIQLNQVQSYQRNEAALDQLRVKLGETQRKAMDLRKAMAADPSDAKLGKSFARTEATAVKLSATLGAQRATLRQEGQALRTAGIDTNRLNMASERLSRTFDAQKSTLARHYGVMSKRKALLGELTSQWAKLAGAVMLSRRAIGASVEFESAMAGVKQAVTFDTPQQFQQMGDDIDALSRKLGVADNELAGLVKQGGELALPHAQLVGFAEDSVKLGVAFGLSAHDAGQAIGQWRAAFHLNEAQAIQTADAIGMLGRTTGANAAEITQFVATLGASGEAAGFTATQIAALTGSMVQAGIPTEKATEGVSALITTLGAGRAATDQQRAAFAELGIDATKLANRMQTDAAGGVVALMKRLKELPQAARMEVLQNLFGKKGVANIAPLIDNLDKLRENLHNVTDASKYAGEMQRRYDEQNKTSAAILARGKESWNTLTQIIGDTFKPVLVAVVGAFNRLVDAIARVNTEFPVLTKTVVAAGAAFLGFKTATSSLELIGTFLPKLGKLGGLVRMLIPGLGMAEGAAAGLSGVFAGLGAALEATPIGWVITAIAALAAGALLVRKYWEPIKAFFVGVWQGLKEAMEPVLTDMAESLAPLKPAWDAIASAIGPVVAWFKDLLNPMHATQEQLDKATGAGKVFGHALGFAFKVVSFNIRYTIKAAMWLGTTLGKFAGWYVVTFTRVTDWWRSRWRGAIGFVTRLWGDYKAGVAIIVDWISAKIDWVLAKWESVKNTVAQIGDVAGQMMGTKPTAPEHHARTALGRSALALALGPMGMMFATNSTALNAIRPSGGASAISMPAARGNTPVVVQAGATNINIHPAAGVDPVAIGAEVDRRLDARDRKQAARVRSTLGDTD